MDQSIGIRLDSRRKQPLHRQLFDEVVTRIQTRTFPAGYKLPATRVLAAELGMHRNTVARAYAELEAAGFVSSTVGRGTFVEPAAVESAAAATRTATPGAQGLEISWTALLSRAARSEAMDRSERQSRRSEQRPSTINLARMQLVKAGDPVVVSGNPARDAADLRLRMVQ